MNKKVILYVGLALICLGLFKPNLGFNSVVNNVSTVEVVKPTDPALSTLADKMLQSVKGCKVSKEDGLRLATLCFDISTLISLDGSSEVIKNTEEIRQANRLAGLMLRMDMNKKYPELAPQMNSLVVGYIGDDIVSLNSELRLKSSDAFKALAWAFIEGTK